MMRSLMSGVRNIIMIKVLTTHDFWLGLSLAIAMVKYSRKPEYLFTIYLIRSTKHSKRVAKLKRRKAYYNRPKRDVSCCKEKLYWETKWLTASLVSGSFQESDKSWRHRSWSKWWYGKLQWNWQRLVGRQWQCSQTKKKTVFGGKNFRDRILHSSISGEIWVCKKKIIISYIQGLGRRMGRLSSSYTRHLSKRSYLQCLRPTWSWRGRYWCVPWQ